jgi:hypothetical protein
VSAAVRWEVIDRVLFARWTNPPSKQDVSILLGEASALRERLGAPLIYVACIDAKVKIPNAAERANLNDMLSRGRTLADSATSSSRAAICRTAFSASSSRGC